MQPVAKPWWVGLLVAVVNVALAAPSYGQHKPAEVPPQDFDILVPIGVHPKRGAGRKVFIDNFRGRESVAKLYVEIGDRYMVILPNGRLKSILKREVAVTARPFEPSTKEEMLAQLLANKIFAGFKSRTTERYIYLYSTSEQYCETNGTILESIFPALKKYFSDQGVTTHDPLTPLVVVMFGTEEEFQNYRQVPDGVVGYYDPVTNWVVMYEQSKLADAAPTLAIKQCISTVVHEGVHQILHNIGVQPRMSEWPKWLSEGLAEYCSPTRTDGDIRWQGIGEIHHLRMHSLLAQLEKQDDRRENGQLVRDIVASAELDSDGYATAWALNFYLIKNHSRAYFEHLREVQRVYGPFAVQPPDTSEIFAKHFGNDWDQLQNDMIANAKALPYVDPILNQPHYVALVETRGWRKVLITTSPNAVHQWKQQVMKEVSPGQQESARFQVQILANKQEAENRASRLLGKSVAAP